MSHHGRAGHLRQSRLPGRETHPGLIVVVQADFCLHGEAIDRSRPRRVVHTLRRRLGGHQSGIAFFIVCIAEHADSEPDQQIHAQARIIAVPVLEHLHAPIEDLVRSHRLAAGAERGHHLSEELVLCITAPFLEACLIALDLRFAHLDQSERGHGDQSQNCRGGPDDCAAVTADKLSNKIRQDAFARFDGLVIQIALQILGERCRRRIAFVRSLAQCLAHDRIEISAQSPWPSLARRLLTAAPGRLRAPPSPDPHAIGSTSPAVRNRPESHGAARRVGRHRSQSRAAHPRSAQEPHSPASRPCLRYASLAIARRPHCRPVSQYRNRAV